MKLFVGFKEWSKTLDESQFLPNERLPKVTAEYK